MENIIKRVVTHKSNPNELYLVIGIQLDIDDQENVVVLLSKSMTAKFMNIHEITVHPDKTIKDVFDSSAENKLFCYHCITHVKPKYIPGVSEYYVDIDKKPIEGFLPHCPICKQEVYSIGYHSAAEDFINFKNIENEYFKWNV